MARVHVLGGINMDLAGFGPRLPRPGETVLGTTLATSPGGKALNQAVAARRLGGDVALVARMGSDAFGAEVRAFLEREGIDLSGVVTIPGAATGVALILVDAASENAIMVLPGANARWDDEAPAAFAPAAGDIVAGQFEIPLAVTERAFARARERGARTLLNPSPVQAVSPPLLASTDILVVNEHELATLAAVAVDPANEESVAAAAERLAGEARTVIATLGPAGSLWVGRGGRGRVPGRKVAAVDTTGAGDCFLGALAARLAAGDGLDAAICYANRAAAVSVTRKGTAIAMPQAGEVG
jgi:ribokinase